MIWRRPDSQGLPDKLPNSPTCIKAPEKGTQKSTWANQSGRVRAFLFRFAASYLPAAACGRKNPFICRGYFGAIWGWGSQLSGKSLTFLSLVSYLYLFGDTGCLFPSEGFLLCPPCVPLVRDEMVRAGTGHLPAPCRPGVGFHSSLWACVAAPAMPQQRLPAAPCMGPRDFPSCSSKHFHTCEGVREPPGTCTRCPLGPVQCLPFIVP